MSCFNTSGLFDDSKGVIRCLEFDEFVWQKHGFGSRLVSPAPNLTLRQVHSADVWNADGMHDQQQEGDALITNVTGRCIGVRTADCVPMLLLDCRTRAVAAIHAGWRGTAAEIARATIRRLGEDFGTHPGDLYVAIGPCIRSCCYEVSSDVIDRFSEWPESVQTPGNAKPRLDLAQPNRSQLLAAGVPGGQIFDCGLCTCCDADQFFSFRREPDNPGRMLSSICRI